MRGRIRVFVLLWATLAGVLLLPGCRPPPEETAPASAGAQAWAAPEVTVPSLNGGGRISLNEYQGKVLLLDFWATWCLPCRSEIPTLNSLYRELSPEGLVVIGMTVDRGPADRVAERVRRLKVQYPAALAGASAQSAFGGIRVVPTKILIDRHGRVRDRIEGVLPEPALRAKLQALLDES